MNDPDELVRWAEMYGHPEEWAKTAQHLHAENERLRGVLAELADDPDGHGGFAVRVARTALLVAPAPWTRGGDTMSGNEIVQCPECGGTGAVTEGDEGVATHVEDCSKCRGTGISPSPVGVATYVEVEAVVDALMSDGLLAGARADALSVVLDVLAPEQP